MNENLQRALYELKATSLALLAGAVALGIIHFVWTAVCGLTGIDRGY